MKLHLNEGVEGKSNVADKGNFPKKGGDGTPSASFTPQPLEEHPRGKSEGREEPEGVKELSPRFDHEISLSM